MNLYKQSLAEAITIFEGLAQLESHVHDAAQWCIGALRAGGKVLACGNGGSAAEAQHFCGELMGRYKSDREALGAVSLSSDSTLLTCVGNDYSFEELFERQVRALGRPGDVLVVFTTSGGSPNVLRALAAARELGLKSIAFLGRDGGKALELADCSLLVRHPDSPRAQEAHQFLMHCLMDEIELGLSEEPAAASGPGKCEAE
jgi:D-sedoheptulose 7-phosphate isomerase